MKRFAFLMMLLLFIVGCDNPVAIAPPEEEEPIDTVDTTPTENPETVIALEWEPRVPIVPAPDRNIFFSVSLANPHGVARGRIENENGDVLVDTTFHEMPESATLSGFIPVKTAADTRFRVVAVDTKGNVTERLLGNLSLVEKIAIARVISGDKSTLDIISPDGAPRQTTFVEERNAPGPAANFDGNWYYFVVEDLAESCQSAIYRVRHDLYGERERIPYDCGYGIPSHFDVNRDGGYIIAQGEVRYQNSGGHNVDIGSVIRIDTKTGNSVNLTPPHCKGKRCYTEASHAFDRATDNLYVGWMNGPSLDGWDSLTVSQMDLYTGELIGNQHTFYNGHVVAAYSAHEGDVTVLTQTPGEEVWYLGYLSMTSGELRGPYLERISNSRFSREGGWMTGQSFMPSEANSVIFFSSDGERETYRVRGDRVQTPYVIATR